MSLWRYASKTWASKGWEKRLAWVVRSRPDPIKEVAKTIKEHLWGILNEIVLEVSNGPAEGRARLASSTGAGAGRRGRICWYGCFQG